MTAAPSATGGLDPDAYAEWRVSSIGSITEALERRLVVELLGEVAGRDVLDVGCGDGALAVALARRGGRMVAVDASAAMIAGARRRAEEGGADILLCRAEADRLPFGPARFDRVIAIAVLCFIEDAVPSFAEMARVLRPGGRLVIGELGKWSTWAASRRVRAWLGSTLWRAGRFRRAAELRRLATGAGLAVTAVRGAIFYPRSAVAARLLAPLDSRLGRLTTLGAAFVAMVAEKAPGDHSPAFAAHGGAQNTFDIIPTCD